jgi:hypothetical protein
LGELGLTRRRQHGDRRVALKRAVRHFELRATKAPVGAAKEESPQRGFVNRLRGVW